MTSTAPAVPGGTIIETVVLLMTPKLAGVPSTVTDCVPLRFVPSIFAEFPPVVGPLVGLMLVIVGALSTQQIR